MKIRAAEDSHMSTGSASHIGDAVAADLLVIKGDPTSFDGPDMIGRAPICTPGRPADGGWLKIDMTHSTVSVTFHDSF